MISLIANFSLKERWFVLFAMLSGFCITMDYSIVRPVSNSVFIQAFGAEVFPWAWLATIPLNFLIVSLYNRFLPSLGCFKMFLAILSCIATVNLVCAFYLQDVPFLSFLFYVWKEIYVMLLFQQVWSIIHTNIDKGRAKYLYGLLFAVGGTGGILGSLIPGFLAVKVGSASLLLFSLPIYVLLAIFYRAF
jgi:ATP:ADP antiporter, AAA family